MVSKLLVSFCNVFPRGLALGVFNFDNNEFQWIDLDKLNKNINGVSDIKFYKDEFWFLTQEEDEKSGLYSLDMNFKIGKKFSLKEIHDAHSFIPFNDSFLATDTSQNRIIKIEFSKDGKDIHETEFWRYNDDQIDTVHLNSISERNNKIYVSLFGPKSEDGWLNSKLGKIIEITEKKIILENLKAPHSLMKIDQELYCLESMTGNIYRFYKNGKCENILKLSGFVRGITFDEKYFYIASSARRIGSRSKKTGGIFQPGDPENTHSFIYRINRGSLEYEKKDLTVYGGEIYELLFLPNSYKIQTKENPIIQRMWEFQNEYYYVKQNNILQEKIINRMISSIPQKNLINKINSNSKNEQKNYDYVIKEILWLYSQRPDLQKKMPNQNEENFYHLLEWALNWGMKDGVAKPFVKRFENELREIYKNKRNG